MTGPDESSPHRVATVAAARFLVDPRSHHLLMAFVPRARPVGAVAAELGLPLLVAWRLARRAVALGLLRVESLQPRAGRALRLYRATAPAFLVPDELMPRTPGELLTDRLREQIRHELAAGGAGLVLRADPDGKPRILPLEAEGRPARPFEAWRILRLDARERQALEAELRALLDRYEGRQQPRGRAFLVHAAMVAHRP